MPDTLTLTLLTADGRRCARARQVHADAQAPHTLLPHVLELAQQNHLPGNDFETEVALADSGKVIYLLRCLA
ncbi:hypothetical protein [Pseudonocardia sp. D17]|jgi:hypothetical protein|uniref:hypothetical protein n=1 Tax=Pseudonocardia sp. D17 TaxID=882661 RepID=UPI002B3D877C|nr:hypothetical protein PSD17_03850 [Pseudonocardia sp. D17]